MYGEKTSAWNWIPQRQCPQHGANGISRTPGVALKLVVAKIDEDTFARLPGTRRPTFDSYTEITHEV